MKRPIPIIIPTKLVYLACFQHAARNNRGVVMDSSGMVSHLSEAAAAAAAEYRCIPGVRGEKVPFSVTYSIPRC